MTDPCTAAQAELDAMTQWSQAKYQLQRWMWNNGCPSAEPPDYMHGWARPWWWPPRSYTVPGDPDDRQPPEN